MWREQACENPQGEEQGVVHPVMRVSHCVQAHEAKSEGILAPSAAQSGLNAHRPSCR